MSSSSHQSSSTISLPTTDHETRILASSMEEDKTNKPARSMPTLFHSTASSKRHQQQQDEPIIPSNKPDARLERRQSSVQQAAAVTTDATRRMVCGGLAGMIAKTVTNPLDRIRMLSQTGEGGKAATSVFALYRNIIHAEGVIGLWAGNGANLLRVFPAKAVVFSSNDMYKSMLTKFVDDPKANAGTIGFLGGGLAGMTASACTYPLDLARGRITGKLATVSASGGAQKAYGGILQTVMITVKDEGFFALYKGITPTLLGAMPYEGIKFGTVGILEVFFPADSSESTLSGPWRKMLFGGAGGVMAGIITYPNDTIRRLLQLQGSRGTTTQYKGYWDCAVTIVKTQGVGRLYRGVTLNVVRMAPNTAVQFGSYELLKQWTAEWI